MGLCEMCGKEGDLFKANIEGSVINVCSGCAKFGKVLSAVKEKIEKKKIMQKPKIPEEEINEIVVPDFSNRIRQKREELGLNQEDFAKKMNEKVSVIHKLETGEFVPSLDLARKFEKILHIKLVEKYKESVVNIKRKSGEGFTIGDVIKIRKR